MRVSALPASDAKATSMTKPTRLPRMSESSVDDVCLAMSDEAASAGLMAPKVIAETSDVMVPRACVAACRSSAETSGPYFHVAACVHAYAT